MASTLSPIHPGEILREEYLVPLDLSAGALAKALDVPRTRIERLVNEETSVTADTALRLARYFKTSPEMWLNLQSAYEVRVEGARRRAEIMAIVPREEKTQIGRPRGVRAPLGLRPSALPAAVAFKRPNKGAAAKPAAAKPAAAKPAPAKAAPAAPAPKKAPAKAAASAAPAATEAAKSPKPPAKASAPKRASAQAAPPLRRKRG